MRRYRWLVWGAYFLVWAYLLTFFDVPDSLVRVTEAVMPTRRFYVAKAVHLSGYAAFAALSGWLCVRQRYRPLLLFVLMIHGSATEICQEAFTNRDARLLDVGLNHVGVFIGFVLTWKWWMAGDGSTQQSFAAAPSQEELGNAGPAEPGNKPPTLSERSVK